MTRHDPHSGHTEPAHSSTPLSSRRRVTHRASGFVLAYLVDLAATRGDIPRGVHVSGVALGGLSESAAQQTLTAELTPDLSRNVPIRAGSDIAFLGGVINYILTE